MDKDPRNTLYKYYVEFLKKYRKAENVCIENVPGILSAKNGQLIAENIFKAVREAGYKVSLPTNKYNFLNAKDFGVYKTENVITWLEKNWGCLILNLKTKEYSFQVLKDLFADLKPLKMAKVQLERY